MSEKYLAPAYELQVDGAKVPREVMAYVTSVSVTLRRDGMDGASLSVANPYPELPWTHGKYATYFKEGAALKVSLGYVDKVAPLFDGEITRIGLSFPESGSSTLSITADSRLHRLQGANERTFQNVTDAQVVQKVASEAGLQAAVKGASDYTHTSLTQTGRDLDFLRARARRLGCEVFCVGKELNFVPLRNAGAKKFTLVWGRTASAFKDGKVPLRSFTPALDAQGQVTRVTVRYHDARKNETYVGEAEKGKENSTMGGEQSGPAAVFKAFGKAREILENNEAVLSVAEAQNLARAIFNEKALSFITGQGSSIGLPDLVPGIVIGVEGVGALFEGEYLVDSATHALGTSGYGTTFTVLRNAAG